MSDGFPDPVRARRQASRGGGLTSPGPRSSGTRTSALPADLRRDEVQRLLQQGAQLVEVLPREEYEHGHIAGAVNIPLRSLEAEAGRVMRDQPVIVYCHDSL